MNLSILKRLNNVNFVAKRKFLVISLLAVPIFFLPMQSKVEAFSLNPIEIKQSVSGFYEELKESIMKKFGFGKENTETTVPVPEIGTETNDYHPTMREFHPEQQETPDPIDVQRMRGESSNVSGQNTENSKQAESLQSKPNDEIEEEYFTTITKGENKEGKVDTSFVSTNASDSQWDGPFKDPEGQGRLDKIKAEMEAEIQKAPDIESERTNDIERRKSYLKIPHVQSTLIFYFGMLLMILGMLEYERGSETVGWVNKINGMLGMVCAFFTHKKETDAFNEWYNEEVACYHQDTSLSKSQWTKYATKENHGVKRYPEVIDFTGNDELYHNAQWVVPLKNYVDVTIHASKYSFYEKYIDSDGNNEYRELSADELAEKIVESGLYEEGYGIRLLSCDAGRYGLAQKLSNTMGVPVYGASQIVHIVADGELFVDDDDVKFKKYDFLRRTELYNDDSKQESNKYRQSGKWIKFTPQ